MAKRSLVVVESPTKVKTIQKYLDSKYVVKASMGHVRDLPKSKLGVDEKKGFKPEYKVLPAKKKVLEELSAMGVDTINGAPAEQFVQTRKTLVPPALALTADGFYV